VETRLIRELQRGDEGYWRGWTMDVTAERTDVCAIPFGEIESSDLT
jgi:hypothetical protein